MVRNHNNKPSYPEEFNMERLTEIADRAKQGLGTHGEMSNLACYVYSLMEEMIRFGEKRERDEIRRAVNELCLKCGDYQEEHLGRCDGCRWKEARHRQ